MSTEPVQGTPEPLTSFQLFGIGLALRLLTAGATLLTGDARVICTLGFLGSFLVPITFPSPARRREAAGKRPVTGIRAAERQGSLQAG